jgi:hypothetical protein
MDNNLILILNNTILFSISCLFHLFSLGLIVFLFYKIFKTKNLATKISGRIHNYDNELLKVEETLEKIQNE